MAHSSKGPLSGIRVLDLTQFLSGPYGTQMLGDLGADVIKVEAPGGDSSRTVAPHFLGEDSLYFHGNNRNKRSIVIDLKSEGGARILKDLILESRVVVENFRPGVLARLGIDRSEIMAAQPHLIWCSISGFGQSGPYAERPAYDMVVQAISGSMSLTGEEGGKPVRTGIPVGDLAAGLHAVIGVLAALHEVEKTGVGEFIDISMLDCLVSMLSYQGTYYLNAGTTPSLQGRGHDSIPTYRTFLCGDGIDLVVTANTEAMWRSMARTLEASELVDDARFRTNAERLQNKRELWAILEPLFLRHGSRHWFEKMTEAGVPVAIVNDLHTALNDPQVVMRDMVLNLKNDGQVLRTLGNPVKLTRSQLTEYRYPPRLGENTVEILREVLGRPAEEIDGLLGTGVVRDAGDPKILAVNASKQ